MPEQNCLDAFKAAKYQLTGHGLRTIQVLKDAFEMVDDGLEADTYGHGDVIENFESKMAQFLGKEDAVFFPSGTMAQQIALRIWCDAKGLYKVAYHPLCHIEIHEEESMHELHHIKPVLLSERDRVIEFEDVLNMQENVSCLLLELPQREIGGQLPEYQTLVSISDICKERGIKLHLDGARLFEILPYYQKRADEICSLFDSVYVSFYKGIGGIAGAILAGPRDFTKESRVWKRRHGGDLISLYPYIITADHYFNKRIDKMSQYYEEAKELAEMFNECNAVSTIPRIPVSNMFHVHFDISKETAEAALLEVCLETGIGFARNLRDLGDSKCDYEVSIGDQYSAIPKVQLRKAFDLLSSKLSIY